MYCPVFDWDDNGQLTTGLMQSFEYTWDGKLRSAMVGSATVDLVYDPLDNRIGKKVDDGSSITTRRYIVDALAELLHR